MFVFKNTLYFVLLSFLLLVLFPCTVVTTLGFVEIITHSSQHMLVRAEHSIFLAR